MGGARKAAAGVVICVGAMFLTPMASADVGAPGGREPSTLGAILLPAIRALPLVSTQPDTSTDDDVCLEYKVFDGQRPPFTLCTSLSANVGDVICIDGHCMLVLED